MTVALDQSLTPLFYGIYGGCHDGNLKGSKACWVMQRANERVGIFKLKFSTAESRQFSSEVEVFSGVFVETSPDGLFLETRWLTASAWRKWRRAFMLVLFVSLFSVFTSVSVASKDREKSCIFAGCTPLHQQLWRLTDADGLMGLRLSLENPSRFCCSSAAQFPPSARPSCFCSAQGL